jgi:hypothetical protein
MISKHICDLSKSIKGHKRSDLHMYEGPSWSWSYGSWIINYLCNQCLSPLMLWVRISIRAKCTTLCDKVWQWLATGLWFSQSPPVSSINRTDHHDINEILLKVALKQTNKQKQTNHIYDDNFFFLYNYLLNIIFIISSK